MIIEKFIKVSYGKIECKAVGKTFNVPVNWGIELTKLPESWQRTKGKGVLVIVLDTGVPLHNDLLKKSVIWNKKNKKFVFNFTKSKTEFDFDGHSTHVCGIIAGNNKNRIYGVAPEAKILALKVLGDKGSGSLIYLRKALAYCLSIYDKLCKMFVSKIIINMSLGWHTYHDKEIYNLIKRLYKRGAVLCCAAGNEGDFYPDNDVCYPAKYDECIAVAAINKNKIRANWSSDGEQVYITAPGVDIWSTWLDNTYACLSGTSMATPFVSGIIA
ncbi:MAG: S8 family serine peptidase, partial [Promethearchaeota archaeon]